MQKQKARSEGREVVFLDSSVIIAAILFPSGGSFRIIKESSFQNYTFTISHYILEECIKILKKKFPEKVSIFSLFLQSFDFKIMEDLSEEEVENVLNIINFRDAPILAAAVGYKAQWLVTLDKDFLTQEVLKFGENHTLAILTPKEFLGMR